MPLAAILAVVSPLWLLGVTLGLSALTLLIYRRTAHLPVVERCLALSLPGALTLSLGLLLNGSAANAEFNWSSVRLAPAFSLRYGQTIYPTLQEGPVSGHIYGPMAAAMYLPATVFDSPSGAIRMAGFLTVAIFFLPMLAFFTLSGGGSRRGWLWAFWGWLVFLLLVLRSDALSYNAFLIHAEAPALGFTAAACLVLWRSQSPDGSRWHLPLAALLAVLAVWSKQTLLPVMVALPLYLAFNRGWMVACRFCGWLTAALLVTGSLFAAWFGAAELWLNLIAIPGRHPWLRSLTDTSLPWIHEPDYGARLEVLFQAALGLLRRCIKALLILGAIVLGQFFLSGSTGSPKERVREWFRQPWGLCFWVALWLVPTALLGRVKAGGDNNAYGPATCFACLSASVWLIHLCRNYCANRPIAGLNRMVWPVLLGINLASAWFIITTAKSMETRESKAMDFAVSYARQHPGRVYFPWNPLLTLMSEQRAYHFAYGVYDRSLAGKPVSTEHFWAGLPVEVEEVLYATGDERMLLSGYLTNFTREVRLPELPGWVILRRDAGRLPAQKDMR